MRRDELYVADLVDNTRAIQEYLNGISREQWDQDRVRRDAVVDRLLLLGETASALPDILRDRYPDVAWRQIRAFRNLAVHKFFGVDWAVVWKIARTKCRSWKSRRWPSCGLSTLTWHRPMKPDRSRSQRPARGRQQYRALEMSPGGQPVSLSFALRTVVALTGTFAAPARCRLIYQHRCVQSVSRHASILSASMRPIPHLYR